MSGNPVCTLFRPYLTGTVCVRSKPLRNLPLTCTPPVSFRQGATCLISWTMCLMTWTMCTALCPFNQLLPLLLPPLTQGSRV